MDKKRARNSTFPLRLTLSLRQQVSDFAKQDRVAVNKFIEIAIAEKLSRLEHDAWTNTTYPSTESRPLLRVK